MAKLFSKKWFKNVGKSVGGALKVAAPIAAMAIPGVGPLAAAAIAGGGSAAGNALQGHNAKSTLRSGVTGAAAGGVGRLLAGPASGLAKTGVTASKAAPTSLLGKAAGAVGSAGKFALKNKDLILAGLNTVQGAQDEKRGRNLQAGALSDLRGASARLAEPKRKDMSHLFADPGNPYARTGVVARGY